MHGQGLRPGKTSYPQATARTVPFQVFEHTADIGLDVHADTLDTLFADAARGLFTIVRGDNPVSAERTFDVQAQAQALDRLFVRFLNEFVYVTDAEGVVFNDVSGTLVTQQDDLWTASARVTGEAFSHEKHPGCLHVKAATRHGTFVRGPEGDRQAQARVLLDI